jgi:hypothetical protein
MCSRVQGGFAKPVQWIRSVNEVFKGQVVAIDGKSLRR